MQTSEEELWILVKELRAENSALLEIILQANRLVHTEESVQIPGANMQSIGREPWYLKQTRLEREFRKPKLSEISGIPDALDSDSIFSEGEEHAS